MNESIKEKENIEEYQRKILILTETYKKQKSQIEGILQEKENLNIVNRQREEEISRLTFNLNTLEKKFVSLQSEYKQLKETKKSGMLDWVISSSVKDENSLMKDKIRLLEEELEQKKDIIELIHTQIFEVKFELQTKLDSLEVQLTNVGFELSEEKRKGFELNKNFNEKENELLIMSCTLNKLNDTLESTRTEMNKKISLLLEKEKEMKKRLKYMKENENKVNPFSEYSLKDEKNLNMKNDFYSLMSSKSLLVENISNYDQRLLKIIDCIEIFTKQYELLFEFKINEYSTTIISSKSLLSKLKQAYHKMNNDLKLLSFTLLLSFNLLLDIKDKLNGLFNIESMKNIENDEIYLKINHLSLLFKYFVGSIIESCNIYCIIEKLVQSKIPNELKLCFELMSSQNNSNLDLLYDKLQYSSNLLKESFASFNPLIVNMINTLSSNFEYYKITYEMNESSSEVQIKFKLVSNPNHSYALQVDKINELFRSINDYCFVKLYQNFFLYQINIGILMTSISKKEEINNTFHSQFLIFDFNFKCFEDLIDKDKDYISNLTNMVSITFNIEEFIIKLKEVLKNLIPIYKAIVKFDKMNKNEEGLEYSKGIEIKNSDLINRQVTFKLEEKVKVYSNRIANLEEQILYKEAIINNLKLENEMKTLNEKDENEKINEEKKEEISHSTFKLNFFDLNWCRNQINIINDNEISIESESSLNSINEFYSNSNAKNIENLMNIEEYRQINSIINCLFLKICNNKIQASADNIKESVENKSLLDELQVKIKMLEEEYISEKKNKEGYEKNIEMLSDNLSETLMRENNLKEILMKCKTCSKNRSIFEQ